MLVRLTALSDTLTCKSSIGSAVAPIHPFGDNTYSIYCGHRDLSTRWLPIIRIAYRLPEILSRIMRAHIQAHLPTQCHLLTTAFDTGALCLMVSFTSHSRWQHIYNAPAVGAIGLVELLFFPLIKRVDELQLPESLIEVLDYSLLLLQWSNQSLIHPLAFSGYVSIILVLGCRDSPE